MADTELLSQLLVRHVVLSRSQPGLGDTLLFPTVEGTPVVTEAEQLLKLYVSQSYASQDGITDYGSVQTTDDIPKSYKILEIITGCGTAVMQIDGVLQVPFPTTRSPPLAL